MTGAPLGNVRALPETDFMLYVLISLCIVVSVLIIIKKRFSSPFKLIMVFGKKGSGKSCFMVHEMLRHLKRGWIVYTDLPVNIKGVRLINALDLSTFKPEANSLVCLDEAGLTFNNRNYKTFSDGMTEYVKLQRHFKVKMIINSQSFDVDKKLRDCTDSLILQSNILNVISISRPILRSVTLVEPSAEGESRIADRLVFDKIWHWRIYLMPKYFKFFDSFAVPDRDLIPFVEMGVDNPS